MAQTALITGASNGIGLELAKIHAKQGGDLVLVARSADKLNALADELRHQYGVKVAVIAKDLVQSNAATEIFAETERLGITVDILMNNAGIGGHGRFFERDLAKDTQMIQLNITSLTELTHLYLQGMVQRRSGKILNVFYRIVSARSFTSGVLRQQSLSNVIQPSYCRGSARVRHHRNRALPRSGCYGICTSRRFTGC